MCWLFSRAGLMCWLLSVAGRVNKEDLRELMPIFGVLTRVTFFRVVTGGFFSPIDLPMRVVLPELMLILGLLLRVTLRVVETDGFFVLIELPMRVVLLELMLTFGLLLVVTFRVVVTGDFFSPMDLATRTVLFELTRLLVLWTPLGELIVVRFPALELTLTDLLTLEGLKEDLRALEVTPGRTVRWLDVILLDGRLPAILLGARTLDLGALLELLRLDGLETLGLVTDPVTREGAVLRAGVLLALEDGRALGAPDVLLAGWLFRLLELDLLLPELALFATACSANSIKAKISAAKAILTFPRYFSVNIICLLSY